jgi:D-arabinitol dehydrogenase (NADP+)
MTEPTACAIHGMDVLDLRPGSEVLVFGAGPTGLVLAQLLVHGGAARVTVAAPTGFKLALAREYGVDTTVQMDRANPGASLATLRDAAPDGYDVVVEATGATSVGELCLPFARDGGTVLIYGMADEQAVLPLHPYEIFRRELTVKGSFAQTHCFDRALGVLRSGRVRTDGIVTHNFDLGDYGRALEALRDDPSCMKAAIVP